MKTTGIVHRFIILLLFLAMLVTPCAADVCVYKPPVVRQIVGTVVDSSGQPIPGVKVVVTEAGATVASATTGDAGSFRFDTLKEGAYELAATATDFREHGTKSFYIVRQHTGTGRCGLYLQLDSRIAGEKSE